MFFHFPISSINHVHNGLSQLHSWRLHGASFIKNVWVFNPTGHPLMESLISRSRLQTLQGQVHHLESSSSSRVKRIKTSGQNYNLMWEGRSLSKCLSSESISHWVAYHPWPGRLQTSQVHVWEWGNSSLTSFFTYYSLHCKFTWIDLAPSQHFRDTLATSNMYIRIKTMKYKKKYLHICIFA